MMFGGIANSDHVECIRIIHKALDSGINFVDTADRYSNGESRSSSICGKSPMHSPKPAIPEGSVPGACVCLGGPRECLRVDILPDALQFAILKGNVEDPVVLERLIRGFDLAHSDADGQNPVSLRHDSGGLGKSLPPLRMPSEA
jgi:hypothetical protein